MPSTSPTHQWTSTRYRRLTALLAVASALTLASTSQAAGSARHAVPHPHDSRAPQAQLTGSSVAVGNDYPWPNANPKNSDPYAFFYRECTSFVAWRMNRDAGTTSKPYSFTNFMRGGHWGNAGHWRANASALGYTHNSTPAVGAVAWWPATAKSVGHVAYVDAVNADGSVNVEEYNLHLDHKYGTRTHIHAVEYIHIHDQDPANTHRQMLINTAGAAYAKDSIGNGGLIREPPRTTRRRSPVSARAR